MVKIKPVHNSVQGRVRYEIPGLKRSESMQHCLETQLKAKPYVTRVCASPVTGKLLVIFDKNCSEKISSVIEQAMQQNAGPINRRSIKTTTKTSRVETEKKSKAARAMEKIQALIHTRQENAPEKWFNRTSADVITHFQSDAKQGIPSDSVEVRRREYGENILPKSQARSGLKIFCEQMNSLPVYLLGAAAGVSVLTGGLLDAAIIFGVVVANSAVGYVTEVRAEKNIDALNDLVHHMAEVVRDGKPVFISAEEVVPGDLLLLKPGSYVPADCRIIQASQLTIDESMLTGESLPVEKQARPISDTDIGLADRINMGFMGTCITGGQGRAVVVATGRNTEIGQLKILLEDTLVPRMPIERQLDSISNQLILMCGAVCSGVFGMGVFMGFGVLNMLRMSISLAAAAVPEGLPTIATINFAIGLNRMKKDNIIVRRLPAVETIGAIQTICLDKTGTITRNKMTVTTIYAGGQWIIVENNGLVANGQAITPFDRLELERLYSVCALCCETRINGTCSDGRLDISGSATESALTELVNNAGIDVKKIRKASPLIEIHHRSEKQLYMSTIHKTADKDQHLVMVKGSPLEVLLHCDSCMTDGQTKPLTPEIRARIEQANASMAQKAQRVLGFACRTLDADSQEKPETNMTWLGLTGMTDPPREGIKELIAQFHRAGVRTVMITGDQQISACAIASDLNLSKGEPLDILDAHDLNTLDEETLIERARTVHVYSRVTPSQKLKIVKAIQASGQTVAMTGDGINDSPALKAADIGIAMGESGTDLARDVADIVLTRDNLELLATTLADGRSIYQNIRKSVHFSLSTNISEIQLITTAIILGINSPLNVMQLLWINLISDIFPGLALSAEKPENDVMDQKPRNSDAPLFTRKDFRTMFVESSTITGGAMGALLYGMSRYGAGAAAGGLAFQALTFSQLLHAITCRSESSGLFTRTKLPRNRYMTAAIGGSILLQVMTVFFPPLRALLGLSRISLLDGLVIGAASTLPLMINEFAKVTRQETLQMDQEQDKPVAESEEPESKEPVQPVVIHNYQKAG
ncbi:MAG: HAD-IC family P-type ATPase [Pseudomonadota bacterium]